MSKGPLDGVGDFESLRASQRDQWKFEVSGPVCVVELPSWRAFFDEFFSSDTSFGGRGEIWRGHQKDSWLLDPTLDRQIKRNGDDSPVLRDLYLKKFKAAVRGRRGPSPKEIKDENEWWALGQHHGLHTPLLDWTTSPFVAAFFAFSERDNRQQERRAIFALDRRNLERVSNGRIENRLEFYEPLTDENPRLVSQGGLFTRAPHLMDVESWVRRYGRIFDPEGKEIEAIFLTKYTIPNSERYEALRTLDQMNINYLSLFPDLEGASLHCNMTWEGPPDE